MANPFKQFSKRISEAFGKVAERINETFRPTRDKTPSGKQGRKREEKARKPRTPWRTRKSDVNSDVEHISAEEFSERSKQDFNDLRNLDKAVNTAKERRDTKGKLELHSNRGIYMMTYNDLWNSEDAKARRIDDILYDEAASQLGKENPDWSEVYNYYNDMVSNIVKQYGWEIIAGQVVDMRSGQIISPKTLRAALQSTYYDYLG